MMVSSISVGVCPFKTSTRLIGDAREGRPVPHVGLPAKIVDRGGHGKRVVDAGQGRGSPGGCAGEVREGVEEGQGTDAGRGLLGHGLEPGQRTPAPGGGGRAPAGPWEAGARGQGPQVLLTGALKILQRVWAAGGGVVAVSTSRSPCRCCWTCWRGPVSSTASPATNPAVRAGPGGHERGDRRPLSRPGRGPRRARPVHGQGPVPACAAPSRSAGPAGEVEAEPGPLRGPSPSPTAVRCSRGSSPGPLSTTRCAHGVDLHPLDPRASPTRRIISAPGAAVDAIPFPVLGMDFDNGSEFTGHGVVRWAGNLDIYFTRSRPHGKNDQATIETREATTWCAATPPYYRHGRRRRAPGAGPPVGAGPTPESTS